MVMFINIRLILITIFLVTGRSVMPVQNAAAVLTASNEVLCNVSASSLESWVTTVHQHGCGLRPRYYKWHGR